MADNVIASAAVGTGATFATDEITSIHYPRTKIIHGADGVNDGDVAKTNPFPVELTDVDYTVVADIGDIETNTDSLVVVGGGIEATALRVTLANDSTGTLTVDTAGTAGLEVIQATAADLNMTEASAAAIKTSVEIIDNAISGTEMQVDVVASLPAGTNAIGKLAANSGVDIGDVDVTTLPGSIQGPASPTVDSYANVAINLTTGANQVLVSSALNKQIWVYGYAFSCGDANGQTVSLQDEDDTAVTGIMSFAQYGGISVPPSGNFSMPAFKLATDKDLEIDITGGDVDGWLAYAIVSV